MGWGYTLAVTVNQASLTVFRGDLRYSCKGLNDCVSPQANTETLILNVMISQSASFRRKNSCSPNKWEECLCAEEPRVTSKCLTCLTPGSNLTNSRLLIRRCYFCTLSRNSAPQIVTKGNTNASRCRDFTGSTGRFQSILDAYGAYNINKNNGDGDIIRSIMICVRTSPCEVDILLSPLL